MSPLLQYTTSPAPMNGRVSMYRVGAAVTLAKAGGRELRV